MRRRLLAIVALLVAAATIGLAVAVVVGEFPRGLLLVGCVLITGAAAWYGVLRRGLARVVGLIVAGLGLAGALVLLLTRGAPLVDLLVVVDCWCRWLRLVPLSPCMWICRARRRRGTRCSSTTRSPVAAKRALRAGPGGRQAWDRGGRAQAR